MNDPELEAFMNGIDLFFTGLELLLMAATSIAFLLYFIAAGLYELDMTFRLFLRGFTGL